MGLRESISGLSGDAALLAPVPPVDTGLVAADDFKTHHPAPVDTDPLITDAALSALAGRPGGMARDELERAVNRAHPNAGERVPSTINALLLAGRIGKVNGRLVPGENCP